MYIGILFTRFANLCPYIVLSNFFLKLSHPKNQTCLEKLQLCETKAVVIDVMKGNLSYLIILESQTEKKKYCHGLNFVSGFF